jgi:hypothetical protein
MSLRRGGKFYTGLLILCVQSHNDMPVPKMVAAVLVAFTHCVLGFKTFETVTSMSGSSFVVPSGTHNWGFHV